MREGWTQHTLGELCTIVKGTSPTMKTAPGQYPLIVTAAEPLSSSEYQFDGEAVCIPMVSSTGHGHASLKRVHYASGKFAVANIIAAVQAKNPHTLSTKFLALYLQHFKDELIVTRMRGTANVSLSLAGLATIPVSLPPLEEQQRIVDLIGALDDTVNSARAGVDASRLTLRSIRASVFEASSALGTTPLGNLAVSRLGKMLSASVSSTGEMAPYLRNADVQWGRLNLRDLKLMPFSDEDRIEFVLKKDDVLVCEGGVIGRSVVLESDVEGVFFQKAIHRVRCSGKLNPHFLQSLLAHLAETGGLDDYAGGSTIAHLTGEKLRRIPVPRMGRADQDKAVETFSVAASVVDRASAFADSLRTTRAELLSVLLSGEHEIPESYDTDTAVQLEPAA